MAEYLLETYGFPRQYAFPLYDKLRISKREIVRAISTIGAADAWDYRNNWSSQYISWLHHTALGLCEIVETQSDPLRIIPSTYRLDRSQIAHISYWMGLALAKHVADSKLSLPWLFWTERIDELQIFVTWKTKHIPDLIGIDQKGKWHVMEAKGLGRRATTKQKNKFKDQAEAIKSINGAKPSTTSVSISTINQYGTIVEWFDPPLDDSPNGVFIEFENENFFRSYYRGIANIIKIQKVRELKLFGFDYSLSPLFRESSSYWIGMPKILVQNPSDAPSVCKEIPMKEISRDIPDGEGYYIGTDGIVIIDNENLLDAIPK